MLLKTQLNLNELYIQKNQNKCYNKSAQTNFQCYRKTTKAELNHLRVVLSNYVYSHKAGS